MPWVIHRAIFGTFERFIGMMLEHTDGNLPVWLAPVQARVLYVSDDQRVYAEEVVAALNAAGVRAELDTQNATLGKKIRAAEIVRIPLIAVIGEKETASRTVSVRNEVQAFDTFVRMAAEAAQTPLI
jgi:threonyl-tRNA synthetase